MQVNLTWQKAHQWLPGDRIGVRRERRERGIKKGREKAFGSDGYVYCLHHDDGSMRVCENTKVFKYVLIIICQLYINEVVLKK